MAVPEPQYAYLAERCAWLVRVRWVAVSGALMAAFVPVPGLARFSLAGVALVLAVVNASFSVRVHRGALGATVRDLEDAAFRMLLADIGALALIVHFSGGGENPAAFLFPLPMALGATLLRTGQAASLAVTGTACHALVVLGELWGLLPHHSLDAGLREATGATHAPVENELFSDPAFVAVYLALFALMNFGVVYFGRSVTARFHQAEALRRDRERLAESRERLARIGELSAGVAHTIRNPVHGLLNAVALLKSQPGDAPGRQETLELMTEALQRVESVTRRLLALGRDAPVHPVSCDVDTLVEDVTRLSNPESRGSAARLVVVAGGAGEAALDAVAIGEALGNVVDNALDACAAGGNVTVRTRGEAAAAVVEVKDDGPGIAPEHLPVLFDPFFTTKPVGQGTGLGLAIAQRIVEAHGGTIAVDSAPGQGTTVRLRLLRTPQGAGSAG